MKEICFNKASALVVKRLEKRVAVEDPEWLSKIWKVLIFYKVCCCQFGWRSEDVNQEEWDQLMTAFKQKCIKRWAYIYRRKECTSTNQNQRDNENPWEETSNSSLGLLEPKLRICKLSRFCLWFRIFWCPASRHDFFFLPFLHPPSLSIFAFPSTAWSAKSIVIIWVCLEVERLTKQQTNKRTHTLFWHLSCPPLLSILLSHQKSPFKSFEFKKSWNNKRSVYIIIFRYFFVGVSCMPYTCSFHSCGLDIRDEKEE